MSQDFEPFESADPEPVVAPRPLPVPAPPPPSSFEAAPIYREEPPRRSPFPLIIGVLMAATLVGAWLMQPAASTATASAAPADSAKPMASNDAKLPEPAETKEKAAATAPARDETKALKAEVDGLSKKLDELAAKVDAAPKPEATVDLKPIHAKLDELSKLPETVAPLPKKVGELSDSLAESRKAMTALQADFASLKEQVDKKTTEVPAAVDTKPAPAPKDENVAGEAFGQAVELFKAKKYKESSDAFAKLQQTSADDARVWYYSALSNGFATKKWDGETLRLLNKGIEREKAGTPKKAEIDAVFVDLDKSNGKDWLAGWRLRAK